MNDRVEKAGLKVDAALAAFVEAEVLAPLLRDLLDVAAATGLSPEAVVQLHAGTVFTVYMLGFMPGFPFMGLLPDALSVPRRREPRVRRRRTISFWDGLFWSRVRPSGLPFGLTG